MKESEIHPVRFTKKQISFIVHMIAEMGMKYWEEKCRDILSTIKQCIYQKDLEEKTENIYTTAKDKIRNHEYAVKHFLTCLQAGICPTCGKTLYLKKKSIPDYTEDITIVACPDDCAIINPDTNFCFSDPAKAIYESCINHEIKEYHKNNYGYGDE